MNETVPDAWSALGSADALMVSDGGKPVGVLTRHDLLTYLTD